MICNVTLKDFKFGEKEEVLFQRNLGKIKKKLTNITQEIIKVDVIIKKHNKNKFFSADFSLKLPHKSLIAKTGGHTLEEVIKEGFEKLDSSFEKYKGTHFKGSSKYPKHERITASI